MHKTFCQLVVLTICIQYGYSYKCVVCTSENDLNCFDLTDRQKSEAQECNIPHTFVGAAKSNNWLVSELIDFRANQETIPNTQMHCLKVIGTEVDGSKMNRSTIVRKCEVSTNTCEHLRNKFKDDKMRNVTYCSMCSEDGCNGALGIFNIFWVPILIITGLINIILMTY